MKFDLLKSVDQNLFDLVKQDNPELKGTLSNFKIAMVSEVPGQVEGRTYFKLTAQEGGLYEAGDSATFNFTKQNLTAIADIFVGEQPAVAPYEATEEVVVKLVEDALSPAIKEALVVKAVKQDSTWVVSVEVQEALLSVVEAIDLSLELTEATPVIEEDVEELNLNGFDNEPTI